MKLFHNVFLGVKRHPWKFSGQIFLAYSALWTLIDSASNFLSIIKPEGIAQYFALIFSGVIFALIRAYQPNSISIKIGHSNTKLTILFADIFDRKGHLAIPVNEFFDSEIGLPVSPNSLHGMVINKFFAGHPASFDRLVEDGLKSESGQDVSRAQGKTRRYEIGTTASIKTSSHNFLLFALSVTDLATLKASATVPNLVQALEGLCAKARVVLNGERLIVPLVGSGLSGLGLPVNQLLQLILLVLINETKKRQFASDVEIVILPDRFEEIDLASIENFWR